MKKTLRLLLLQTGFCLLFATTVCAQAVNITVIPPLVTSACNENIYRVIIPPGTNTNAVITPSVIITNAVPTCYTTDSTQIEYIGHTGSNSISNINSGSKLSFTVVTATAPDTIKYRVSVDCNVIQNGAGTVSLMQVFPANYVVAGSPVANEFSTGVSYPNIQELNANANMTASYLNEGKFTFYYRNNSSVPARLRFVFNADSANNQFCNTITFDSVTFKRNSNGTSFTYSSAAIDSITLASQDTLIIQQYVHSTTCITGCTATLHATFKWQCNFSNAISANFCNNCNNGLHHIYSVNPDNNIAIDVQRISPANINFDFSCMNDTANAIVYSYRIVNKGTTAIDSVNFNISQVADNILSGKNFLMLMSKKSLRITKGISSFCTVTDSIRIKTNRLCYNLIDTAVFNCYVSIKNFLLADTVFVSFKLLRCSEEDNASLFHVAKTYNQFSFTPFEIKTKCGNAVAVNNTTGLYQSGTFVSSQSAGSGYDVDLKTTFFPQVSDLTYANNIGDQATFNVKLNTLLNPKKPYVYQLSGSNKPNALADTLEGWLRATVKVKANLILKAPAADAYLIKVNPVTNDTVYHAAAWWNSIADITSCMDRDYYYYFNLNDAGMRSYLDSGEFVFKLTACCAVDSSPTPYSTEFHLLAKPSNSCFTTSLPATHSLPLIISDVKQKWLPLSDEGNDVAVHCPGCVTPGLIVDFYKMERKTLGLQDSDQDGRSDSANANININSNWYAQNKNKLKQNFSCFGDRIEDVIRSHLEPGSKPKGYTYAQLQAHGLRFNVLQLSRLIPLGLDTMKVLPDSLIFYIDAPGSGTCVDCVPFGLPSTTFYTQLKLVVTGNNIFTYFLDTLKNSNEYLFRFVDTANGNLHNPSFIDPSVANTFNGFFEGQFYRMRVTYTVCGNYSPNTVAAIDDVVKQSKIFNKM